MTMNMTKAEIKYYASLDPRDPDYLDIEEELEGEEPEDGWVDERTDDFIMTEPEKRGAL